MSIQKGQKLIFEAIVIKIEGNKICKVYLKEDPSKTPIIGYLKERLTSDKKQKLKAGDEVEVQFHETDKEKCMILKKLNIKKEEYNPNRHQKKYKH